MAAYTYLFLSIKNIHQEKDYTKNSLNVLYKSNNINTDGMWFKEMAISPIKILAITKVIFFL